MAILIIIDESSGEVVVKVRIEFIRLKFAAVIRTVFYIKSLVWVSIPDQFQFLVILYSNFYYFGIDMFCRCNPSSVWESVN